MIKVGCNEEINLIKSFHQKGINDASRKLKFLIDVNIGHADHEGIEMKFYNKNMTTAPFNYIVYGPRGKIDFY